jgi:hypothetical protein
MFRIRLRSIPKLNKRGKLMLLFFIIFLIFFIIFLIFYFIKIVSIVVGLIYSSYKFCKYCIQSWENYKIREYSEPVWAKKNLDSNFNSECFFMFSLNFALFYCLLLLISRIGNGMCFIVYC